VAQKPLPPRQAVVAAAAALIGLILFTVWIERSDAALHTDAVQPAQAEVYAYRERLFQPAQLRVEYEVPGSGTQVARIDVDARYERGQSVAVLYDPARPRRARTVEHWHAGTPLMTPIVLVGFGLFLLGATVQRLRRSSSR